MKIICTGKNYLQHIAEFDHQIPQEPVFFLKPESAMITRNRPFFLPEFSQEIQYEAEITVKINKVGKYINEKFAHTYYNEIGLGIDFTARDLQRRCMREGNPWEIAKAFDGSAIIGKFRDKATLPDMSHIRFALYLNSKPVQQGNSGDMIFGIDRVISYVSQFMTLKMGDIIFTGTPSGVGNVAINDRLTGYLEDEKVLDFKVK
ncbi:MAG: fumarylacetoacetate hydrolase family protein [Bacteroidales bacterium]|jgi:2-keto-4-pentenoate hydratase/2-oxohepta-3-ene-1,7-dioic acid hydratase in catechol pathway|nr:fumarylacetoacetate hydrolase family protein [Bacteroidales bacterium]